MKKNAGFTLVELIVVIAILAILAGIAIPVYSGYISKANEAADLQVLDSVRTAAVFKAMDSNVNATVTKITVTKGSTVVTLDGTNLPDSKTVDVKDYACYVSEGSAVESGPKLYISDTYAETVNGVNKVAATMNFDVPDGYTLVNFGFYYATNAKEGNREKVTSNPPTASKTVKTPAGVTYGSYTLHVSVKAATNKIVYVRAYLTFSSESGEEVIYTDTYDLVWDDLYAEGKFVQ